MKKLFSILLKGLVVVAPAGATLYVIWWLGASAEAIFKPIFQAVLGEKGMIQYYPGMGVVTGLVLVFTIGLLTYSYLFRKLLALQDRILSKIPLVKSLYGGLRDMMDMFSPEQGVERMNKVVAVKVAGGIRMIGFVTQDDPEDIPGELQGGEQRVAVYLPMSYQLGGFTVFLKHDEIEPMDMNMEDAMRYAMTAGMTDLGTEDQAEDDNTKE